MTNRSDQHLDEGPSTRPALAVGESLTDDGRDALAERLARKGEEAGRRFRETDPRRHGFRLPEAATALSWAERWERARIAARETKGRLDAGARAEQPQADSEAT